MRWTLRDNFSDGTLCGRNIVSRAANKTPVLQKNKPIISENTDGSLFWLAIVRANVGRPGNDIPSAECTNPNFRREIQKF